MLLGGLENDEGLKTQDWDLRPSRGTLITPENKTQVPAYAKP
jgi:hypothetical protein